jgi:hypothetical protein
MPVNTTKLGPGTLTLTPPAGTAVDYSCQVEGLTVTWSKSKDDDMTDPASLVVFTWDNHGLVCGFEFTPNTEAGVTVTGDVVVDPLDVGGDTGGDDMTSDFTWDCVGEPDLNPAAAA